MADTSSTDTMADTYTKADLRPMYCPTRYDQCTWVYREAFLLESKINYLRRGELNSPRHQPTTMHSALCLLNFCERSIKPESTARRWLKKLREDLTRIPKNGVGKRPARLRVRKKFLCPICLEKKKLVDTLELNCRHKFCKECFRLALAERITQCPYCRAEIKTVEGDHKYKVAWNVVGMMEVDQFPDEDIE